MATGLPSDSTMQVLGIVKYWRGQYVVVENSALTSDYKRWLKLKRQRPRIGQCECHGPRLD